MINLQKKYGSTKQKQLYNRAIRSEILGGDILLSTDETLQNIRHRSGLSRDCHAFLRDCFDRLQDIKTTMIAEIDRRYSNPVGRDAIVSWLADLDTFIRSGRLPDDTFNSLNFIRNKLIDILAEMDGEAESKE